MKVIKSISNGLGLSVMTVFFFLISLVLESGNLLKK